MSVRYAARMNVLLLTALWGCAEPSDEAVAAASYAEMMRPVLYENGLLADQFYETAALVQQSAAASGDVQVVWNSRITPLAEHLVVQADLVTPPPEWESRHDELLSIWRSRAEAFRAIGDALERCDRELWASARSSSDKCKIDEEEWFLETNEILKPYRISFDQLP